MAKIKTLDPAEYGKTRTTGLGTLNFNDEGVAELEDQEAAEKLCRISSTLSLLREETPSKGDTDPAMKIVGDSKDATPTGSVGDVDPPEGQETDKGEGDPDPVDGQGDPDPNADNGEETGDPDPGTPETGDTDPVVEYTAEEKEALTEALNEKKIDDLRDICKDGGLNEEEYKDFKGAEGKIQLIKLIIDKKII